MSDVQTLWHMNDLQSLLHFPCFECFASGLEFAIETLSIRMKCWVSKMKKLQEWQVSGSEGHLGNPFIQSSPKYSSNYPQPKQGTLFLPPTAIPKPLCPFPVWTGKYRIPKTLSSSSLMQTSSKGKKRIVLLPHLERPEHNSPSSEELWSRVVHPGAQRVTCAGPAEPSAAPGAQGHWECTVWGSTRDRWHEKIVIWTQTQQ